MSSNNEKHKEFYSNDVVYRFDKRKRIVYGFVTESYEASSDVYYVPALQKGQIRVFWNNKAIDQVWSQNKVRLLCRNVIPGEIVRRLEKDMETQRGYCKEAKLVATVQIVGTDKMIEQVNCERLHRARHFSMDDYVCLGSKFGRIWNVDHLITMQSKCGSTVEILSSINSEVEDYWLSKRNRGLLFESCYPGQEVICIPSNLEQPRWIKKSKAMKRSIHYRQRFTVQNVSCSVIEVVWNNDSNRVMSLEEDEIKKLKVIEDPSDNVPELVERRLLKLHFSDVLIKKKDWLKKQSLLYRPEPTKIRHVVGYTSKTALRVPKIKINPPIRMPPTAETNEVDDDWWTEEGEESEGENGSLSSGSKAQKKHYPPKLTELVPGNTLAVEIVSLESKITVVWQDGTEEKDISSTHLHYSVSLDDHEFFPGEWVIESDNKSDKNEESKYGAIQNVKYLERTAMVKWFKFSESEQKPVEIGIDEVSVYDLKKHPKYIFRPGSVVKAKPDQENKMGRVIDSCPQGYVIVQWIDGTEDNCWPQNIELMPDNLEDLEESCESESDEEGQVSWETESIESYAGDMTDETALQSMAARLDFVKSRIVYLKEAFQQHHVTENFSFQLLRDLLLVYENSSYLDKLLGTSFFSLKSKHFQALLIQAKEKSKSQGVELRGRLFSSDNPCPSITKAKIAEKENINKVIKLENEINAQIESNKESSKNNTEPSTPLSPGSTDQIIISDENLCVELLTMLKIRMDLAYAEIISRLGGTQALSVLTKASEITVTPTSSNTALPSVPITPEESFSALNPMNLLKNVTNLENETYYIIEEAPLYHHYYANKFEPIDQQKFLKTIQKEYTRIRESLPPGIWVRSYSNRLDLLSVMIKGPENTPYADGLFVFDIQLSKDYPRSPPIVHYISYSSERLNPNLYVEGKVCVSLLGTWMGRGTEVWGPNSTLLQLIVSIQGLILVPEPYYNEAGYEKQAETQQGYENSRTYNELVVLKLVQSMTDMLRSPPEVFKQEVLAHFAMNGQKLCQRLQSYCRDVDPVKPDFPLLPVSRGLKLSLNTSLNQFQGVLKDVLSSQVHRKSSDKIIRELKPSDNVDKELRDIVNKDVGDSC